MCLGVPGKVVATETNDLGMLMGSVSFGGITKEVCLAFVPEVKPGDYVIVHAGFAISQLDEEGAQETLDILRQLGEVDAAGAPLDDSLVGGRSATEEPGGKQGGGDDEVR